MRARKYARIPHSRGSLTVFPPIIFLVAAVILSLRAKAAEENLAARVVLLANSEDPDSLRVARHYAEVRGVPLENIIALKLPLAESITWREFVVTLWEPLLDELLRAKWVDAIPMALTDPVGRRKLAVQGHRIRALVTCRGVPLKIEHDPALYLGSPFTQRAEFRTNAGAVDSELSCWRSRIIRSMRLCPTRSFRKKIRTRWSGYRSSGSPASMGRAWRMRSGWSIAPSRPSARVCLGGPTWTWGHPRGGGPLAGGFGDPARKSPLGPSGGSRSGHAVCDRAVRCTGAVFWMVCQQSERPLRIARVSLSARRDRPSYPQLFGWHAPFDDGGLDGAVGRARRHGHGRQRL